MVKEEESAVQGQLSSRLWIGACPAFIGGGCLPRPACLESLQAGGLPRPASRRPRGEVAGGVKELKC